LQLSLLYGIRILNVSPLEFTQYININQMFNFFTFLFKQGIFTSILLILYRTEPVIIFPSGTLWPLEKILSWPTSVDSCISLPTWIVLTEMSVLSRLRFKQT
jgi:hypothetical protein